MTVEVERRSHEHGDTDDVSGTVVNALIGLVEARNGRGGVAQALALAAETRPFSALRDPGSWSSLDQTVALLDAAAMVTGDGAVARHLGEELLFLPDRTGFVGRLQALGSPAVAVKHFGPVLEHFETASKAVILEAAEDHALISVSPLTSPTRHPHLCELTRGLLWALPELFGLKPALITEMECSARGGRHCLYAVSWQGPEPEPPEAIMDPGVEEGIGSLLGLDEDRGLDEEDVFGPEEDVGAEDVLGLDEDVGAEDVLGLDEAFGEEGLFGLDEAFGRSQESPAPELGSIGHANGSRGQRNGSVGHVPSSWTDAHGPATGAGQGERSPSEVPTTPDKVRTAVADRSVAELRAELNRMGVLIEGTFATALELLGDDVESLLSQIAARADAVVTAHSYLLMVRVRPGSPIQLHHRGLEPEEAQHLAAELWREHPDDANGSRLIVDIASPRRRYGRLAEFLPAGVAHPASENKVLNLYAEYAATALDIFGVLLDAKRSDATARTLLSFSEALSRINNVSDLVQLLADTVPEVTECAQSTVHLWDGELRQLIPRAQTAGSDPQQPFVGPIVPVYGSDGPSAPSPTAAPWETPTSRPDRQGPPDGVEAQPPLNVPRDAPQVRRMIDERAVIVLDDSVEDPLIRDLLAHSGYSASVVAPLFANGEFLGVVTANFGSETPAAAVHDADLHERLSGLADQAATTLQNLELLEQVSHMAWHDSLTGLPNRRLFEDRVGQELVRSRRVGEPVCMFFVDLDHFKTVNDTMGHTAGDDLIRQVSQRLVETVRGQDTVARVGGDEFAILLPGLADQLDIDQLAQRSLEALSAPFEVFGEAVATSASIGIAMAPDHGDTYDELLSHADEAMYRAKDRGRNAFQMYSGTAVNSAGGHQVVDERTLYADLVHALEHDEFFVLYQPYIDLRTAQVTGVEALIRWNHPTLGTLEPSSFISVAERSDIIVALDTWVLEQACRQGRTWIEQGLPPLRLSVNLASRDLSNPELFTNIERTLEETGIDPALLELEITERVVLDRSGPGRENIERLRRLGVRFTIDDFGLGNSSLSRIGSFPISTLKIDQSFVQVLGADGDNNALVSAIISMADRLGLACVAEGVETSTQSRVLLQRGCTTAQGYFFSPPLRPEDVESMMGTISTRDGILALEEPEE
jgi:diguanylate cyclase (GGDEF)-like protein